MAEINRDVLRSIILDVLQEMGGVHEAPQFKASAGKSTTPSAAPRHEDPTAITTSSALVPGCAGPPVWSQLSSPVGSSCLGAALGVVLLPALALNCGAS